MVLNPIQMKEKISDYLDRVKSPRFPDFTYMGAINDAIAMTINDRIDSIRRKRNYSVQSVQRIKDELYTLIPTPVTGTTSGDLVPFPATYYYYLLLWQTINGIKQFCRPTNYNQEGSLLENPFMKPTALKPYFNEYSAGLRILHDSSGSMGDYELWYIKKPDVVSIGEERDKLTDGATLVNLSVYYVYDQSVYSGTTYYPGETITGTGAALTSGTVIIAAKITACNLPGNIHEEICKLSASIMSGDVSDWNKKQMLDQDVEKS